MKSSEVLRRRSKLSTSSDKSPRAISSISTNKKILESFNSSAKNSPHSGHPSLDSSPYNESFSDIDTDPNLSNDESCDSSCEAELTSESLKHTNKFVTTSSPGKSPKLPSSHKQNVSLEQEPSSSTIPVWIAPAVIVIIITALVVCLILTMFPFGPVIQESTKHVATNSREIFEMKLLREVKTLQATYPTQDMKTWIDFMAAITSIADSPDQPAVLLLFTPNVTSAIETTNCIAKQLAVATNRLFNASSRLPIHVLAKQSSMEFEDKIKEELDSQIHSLLSQSYAIILDGINNIPPKAAMVLHGYCDNFMAPFKQRVIILTAIANDGWPFNSDKADSFLRNLWDSELGEDKSASLVSRVANMPVFIHAEETLKSCNKMAN